MTKEATASDDATQPGAVALTEGLGVGAEALCMCKDRALSACPGEWEPGCDLGSNQAFAKAAPRGASEQVDAALGMKMISIRLPAALIEQYKSLAAASGAADWRGTGYQVLMRQALTDFAAEKRETPNVRGKQP